MPWGSWSSVTDPMPLPARVTWTVSLMWANVAVTDWTTVIGTTHVGSVPVQPPPLHPVKTQFNAGVSESSTSVL